MCAGSITSYQRQEGTGSPKLDFTILLSLARVMLVHSFCFCYTGKRETLAAVRWPGYEEEEGEGESSNIGDYSDSDSERQDDETHGKMNIFLFTCGFIILWKAHRHSYSFPAIH